MAIKVLGLLLLQDPLEREGRRCIDRLRPPLGRVRVARRQLNLRDEVVDFGLAFVFEPVVAVASLLRAALQVAV